MVSIREYTESDMARMIADWNEVVEDGIAFSQEEYLDIETGMASLSSALSRTAFG